MRLIGAVIARENSRLTDLAPTTGQHTSARREKSKRGNSTSRKALAKNLRQTEKSRSAKEEKSKNCFVLCKVQKKRKIIFRLLVRLLGRLVQEKGKRVFFEECSRYKYDFRVGDRVREIVDRENWRVSSTAKKSNEKHEIAPYPALNLISNPKSTDRLVEEFSFSSKQLRK